MPLVLSRYDDEEVMIGTDEDFKNKTTTTVSVRYDPRHRRIKLLIDAPNDIKILRSELVECGQSM